MALPTTTWSDELAPPKNLVLRLADGSYLTLADGTVIVIAARTYVDETMPTTSWTDE